jgi:putative transposase
MSEKYKNQYRIPSARLQSWDYGWAGMYFITICTKDRFPCLGEIEENKMRLSHAGVIADVCWQDIKNHASNVLLGEYVIMPNHIHGIIVLEDDNDKLMDNQSATTTVETRHALSLQPKQQSDEMIIPPQTPGQQRFQNQGKNTISSIIGSYKAAVTRHANRLEFPFAWQTRFHDHIIRNRVEYDRITQYILNNVATWPDDKFYSSTPPSSQS